MPEPFDRPPRAPAPPVEDWVRFSDRADNAREPFFVGRADEYATFADGARLLRGGRVGGETIIFQGAPGAGKSALMQECLEAVRRHSKPDEQWLALSLDIRTLIDPGTLCRKLADGLREEHQRLAAMGRHPRLKEAGVKLQAVWAELVARGIGIGGARVGAAPTPALLPEGAFGLIADAFRDVRVVLCVDEAQNVEPEAKPALSVLSRGQTGIDILPVFFGLGHAADALAREGGVSRPPAGRVVEMGALSGGDARAPLELAFDAYGVHGRDRERWLDTLAGAAQGWPQHLNRMEVAAMREMLAHGMHCDRADLGAAVAAGEAAKREYYERRLEGLGPRARRPYRELGARVLEGLETFDEGDIDDILAAAGHGDRDPDAWLRDARRRGVVAAVPGGGGWMQVPIPSLAAHLVELPIDRASRPCKTSGGLT